MVRGKPIKRSLMGNCRSLSRAFRSRVEASRNSTRIRVIWAMGSTQLAVIPSLQSLPIKKLMIIPTVMKTIGPVIIDFSDNLEKSPYSRIIKAAKMITGYSFIT